MFGSGRHVPSEGALRVLRQLAYISSGTACGAAAVVAEERRRQITFASKIADNSRRLKQHPRHQHSHARHRPLQDDPPSAHQAPDTLPLQAEAFRNDLLPSEVDKGYSKLNERPPAHIHRQPASKKQLPVDLSPFRLTLKAHGKPAALAQLDAHCQGLVLQNQPQHALRFFYRCVDRLRLAQQSPLDTAAVATRLFDSFLHAKSFTNCRVLMHWMATKDWSIVECLRNFSRYCTTHGEHARLTWLYRTYGSRVDFPPDTYAALCTVYSTQDPHAAATIFAKHISKSDRSSVLPDCKPAWPAILHHLWTKTANLDLVNAVFDDMCRLATPEELTLDSYNAMIHVCIKAGRLDQAHQHLRTVQHSDHLNPDIVTFGHFILLSATSSDWYAVDDLMAMLTRAGNEQAPTERRTDLFVPLLVEYAKQHTSEEMWTFVTAAIDNYGVLPDSRISDVVLQTFVRDRRLALIPAWIDYLKTHKLDAEIAPQAALIMMRQFYFSSRPSHAVLMWLCRRLVGHVPEFGSRGIINLLREATAFDIRSHRSGLAHRTPQAVSTLEMLQDVDENTQHLPKPLYAHQMHQTMHPKHIAQAPRDGRTDFSPSHDPNAQPLNIEKDHSPTWISDKSEHQYTTDTQSPDSYMHLSPAAPMATCSDLIDGGPEIGADLFTQDQPLDLDDSDLVEKLFQDGLPATKRSANAMEERRSESEMLIAFSTGQYSEAVELYRKNLGQSGLPASSYSLEMAIQAQTKARPELADEAEAHIHAAEDAGLNVTAALVPLLIDRIKSSPLSSPTHIDNICHTIHTFYNRMIDNNVRIRHHLATAAASVLTKSNKANDAIRLLSHIYHSSWAEKVPLDLPAMTVFLQAYIKVSHRTGIKWVIDEVLKQDYRIDFAFLTVVRKAQKFFQRRSFAGGSRGPYRLGISRMLEQYYHICLKRQEGQIRRTSRFGNKLVRVLIRTAKAKPAVDCPSKLGSLDPTMWGRALKTRSGRQARYRILGTRSRHEFVRSRRLDQLLRRRAQRHPTMQEQALTTQSDRQVNYETAGSRSRHELVRPRRQLRQRRAHRQGLTAGQAED